MSTWKERIQEAKAEEGSICRTREEEALKEKREAEKRQTEFKMRIWALGIEDSLEEINEEAWENQGQISKYGDKIILSAGYPKVDERWEKFTEKVYGRYDDAHTIDSQGMDMVFHDVKIGWHTESRRRLVGFKITEERSYLSVSLGYYQQHYHDPYNPRGSFSSPEVLRITVYDNERFLEHHPLEGVKHISTHGYASLDELLKGYRYKKDNQGIYAQLGGEGSASQSLVLEFEDKDFDGEKIRKFVDFALLSSCKVKRNFSEINEKANQEIAEITSRIGIVM